MTPRQKMHPEVQKSLSDEKRQYDSERRRLAQQHKSESFRSLTAREQGSNSTHVLKIVDLSRPRFAIISALREAHHVYAYT